MQPNFSQSSQRSRALGLGRELDLVGQHRRKLLEILRPFEQGNHARVRLSRRAISGDVATPARESQLRIGSARAANLGAPPCERLRLNGIRLARRPPVQNFGEIEPIPRRFVECFEGGERLFRARAVEKRLVSHDFGTSVEPRPPAQLEQLRGRRRSRIGIGRMFGDHGQRPDQRLGCQPCPLLQEMSRGSKARRRFAFALDDLRERAPSPLSISAPRVEKADVEADAGPYLGARVAQGSRQQVRGFFRAVEQNAVGNEAAPTLVVAGVARHQLLEQCVRPGNVAEHVLS
jgi:hypothetical protein